MNTKVFIPLPAIDSDYQRKHIVYYPPSWSNRTPLCNPNNNPNSKYITNRNRIRVNSLNPTTTQGDLHERFSCYGAIASISTVKIVQNNYSNRRKEGYAYITFFLEEDAKLALKSSMKFLNGRSIFVHQTIQRPEYVNHQLKPINRIYSRRTMLIINEKYKKLCLEQYIGCEKQIDYTFIRNIDPNMPRNMKRSTILDPDTDDDSISLDDLELRRDREPNPLLEEQVFQSHPVKEESPGLEQPIFEFIPVVPENLCGPDDVEFDNFIYPNPIYIQGNQTYFQDPDQFNYEQSENLSTMSSAYYRENQIIYESIPQHSQMSVNQNDDYYNLNDEYSYHNVIMTNIPEENINYDPYYVDPSMYQDASVPIANLNAFETEYNQVYEASPTVYATFHEYGMSNQLNVENQLPNANYVQVLAPQPMNPPACEYETDYRYYDERQIIDFREYEEIEMSRMQLYDGTFEVPHLIVQRSIPPAYYEMNYQYYNDNTQICAFAENDYIDTPMPQQIHCISEIPHIIEQPMIPQACEMYGNEMGYQYQNDTQMSMIQDNNVMSEVPQLIEQEMISPTPEMHEYESDDLDDGPEIIDLTQYDDIEMSMIPENDGTSEVPRINPYQQFSTSFEQLLRQIEDMRNQMCKSSEADEPDDVQSQGNVNDTVHKSVGDANNCDKYLNISSIDTPGCSTSNQSNLLEIIEPSTSRNTEIKLDTGKSKVELKIPAKTQKKSEIIDESSKSLKRDFNKASVRDFATQFPENLISTFTSEVNDASPQNMETQTICTPENANKETTPLRLTFANATKRSKRKK